MNIQLLSNTQHKAGVEGEEGLDIAIVDTSQKFYNLRHEWNTLLENSESCSIFLTWEWLYHWWEVYGDSKKSLFIITVRTCGKLIGIAPLCIEHKYLGIFREIAFLGSNIVCSEYIDFILMKGTEDIALASICDKLKKGRKEWDLVKLSHMLSTSYSGMAFRSFFAGFKYLVNKGYSYSSYIDLKQGFDENYESYSSRLKNTLRRKKRRAEKIGTVQFVRSGMNRNGQNIFLELVRLNKLGMARKGIRTPFDDERFLAFHQRVFKDLERKGLAELRFVVVEGKAIAGIYLLMYKNRCYFYQSGFDPAWERLSPGTLLFDHCIKWAHDAGFEEFDFLRGGEPYKNDWSKLKKESIQIIIWGKRQRGNVLGLVERIKQRGRSCVREYLLPVVSG